VLIVALVGLGRPVAQPDVDAGHADLGLALRQLNTVGTFMMITAHPDDEDNALFALLSRGQGVRTVLVTATRGDGGQNEIGPELFDALAVLRTEELVAAHRFDGAEQYFARAVDFGYSFSIEETFEKWGREEILSDFVRFIRSIRPDVIAGLSPDGERGGQHHQASAVLAEEALRAAADPMRFPDQIATGLRPWQARKFYFSTGFGFGVDGGRGRLRTPAAGTCVVDLGGFDRLLGRTYAELGSIARSMHKCQGTPQLVSLPGPASAQYRLAATTLANRPARAETSLFEGIDTTPASLALYAGDRTPRELTMALATIARHAQTALRQFEGGHAAEIGGAVLAGLTSVRNLRGQLGSIPLSDAARYEIDFRLEWKERQFERAALLAHGIRIDVLADDGVVTPDQVVTVSALIANHGPADVVVKGIGFKGFSGTSVTCGTDVLRRSGVYRCRSELRIPKEARPTDIHWTHVPGRARYALEEDVPFGLPFRPTPFRADVELEFAAGRIVVDRPVEYRDARDIFTGEKRTSLQVVPQLALRVGPGIVIAPMAATRVPGARDVRVTVSNSGKEAATGEVALELPAGWQAMPERAVVRFAREDEEQTLRFSVTPARNVRPGEYRLRAIATVGDARFDRGYQVVEYPHTGRRHLVHDARTAIKIVDVAVAPDLVVGYITGVGDEVAPAIEQLGARVEPIEADQLAWGDLSRFHVIVTGVRAYERRRDLRANNDRLLRYVEDGGTVIVQYNKFEFNEAQYGPFPAKVSQNRVTDEHAPVKVLVRDHAVFRFPNRIDESTWAEWVQERGLYFLGEKDPKYVDLVELEDAFENNRGIKRGALVEARVGQGRWIYVGLGLWRQLPAGTTGAYQLLANLLSLSKAQ